MNNLNKIVFITPRPRKNVVYIAKLGPENTITSLITRLQPGSAYLLGLDHIIETRSTALVYQLDRAIAGQKLMGRWYQFDPEQTKDIYHRFAKLARMLEARYCAYCKLSFDNPAIFAGHLARCREFTSQFDSIRDGNGC